MYFGLISEYDIVSKRFLYVHVVVSQWAGFPVDERRCIRHTHTRPCDNWPVSLNGFSFFSYFLLLPNKDKCLLTLIKEKKIRSNYNGIGKRIKFRLEFDFHHSS